MFQVEAQLNIIAVRVQGTLRGYDQATNLIMDDSVERIYSTKVSGCTPLISPGTLACHCKEWFPTPNCCFSNSCCAECAGRGGGAGAGPVRHPRRQHVRLIVLGLKTLVTSFFQHQLHPVSAAAIPDGQRCFNAAVFCCSAVVGEVDDELNR